MQQKLIYQEEGYVKCELLDEYKVILVTWYNMFNSSIVEECSRVQFSYLGKGAKYIVLDMSKCKGSIDRDTVDFLQKELYPGAKEVGLHTVVNIHSEVSSLTRQNMTEHLPKLSAPFAFDMVDAGSVEEALAYLKGIEEG